MTALTLPFPSGRGSRGPGLLGTLRQTVSDFFGGIRDGLVLAARYDALASKSDAELARLGLRRSDIPQAVLRGRNR
jgi:hypothetical protein